ncbi:MAG: Trp family transcriptional regulator [Patescibacteria group bacterium]
MKRRAHELSKEEKVETLDALYTAAGTLRGRPAIKAFLKDLLSEGERIMLGRRILIARSLLRGESALAIGQKLKVGYDTVYRVERWLQDTLPGYESAIAGLEKELKRRKVTQKRVEPFTYAWLKKKYPLHFLLFP